jgi:hypothetical protein
LQPLHDEAFAAEEARADALVKSDANADALRRTEEGIFLRNEFAADFREVDRDDLARIRRAERDPRLPVPRLWNTVMNSDSPVSRRLPGAEQRAEETAVLLRAVTEDGLHLDGVIHVHHAARFGDGGFVRVEFQFDELHRVAEHLVINLVHLVHSFAFDKIVVPEDAAFRLGRQLQIDRQSVAEIQTSA